MHPARFPASTSRTESPIMYEADRSIPMSSRARKSIPGCGLRHEQATRYASAPTSGWCGQ